MAVTKKKKTIRPVKKVTRKKKATAKSGKMGPLPTSLPLRKRAVKITGPTERVGVIEIAGKPATVIGDEVVPGQLAPEFHAQANDWTLIDGLAATKGKVRILASVPSLSTDTCDRETRTFNQRASELGDEVRVMVISADLPPTQKRWCGNAGVDRVQTVSDHDDLDFGLKYGTYIKERRYHRRAVFVVDKNDKITYVAYMPALGVEPNYDEVLAAAKAAL